MNSVSCRERLVVLVALCFLAFGGTSAWAANLGSGHSNWGPIGSRDGANQFTLGGGLWEDAYIVEKHPRYARPIGGTRYISLDPSVVTPPFSSHTTTRYRTIITPSCPVTMIPVLTAVYIHADNAATLYLNERPLGQQVQAAILSNFQGAPEELVAAAPVDLNSHQGPEPLLSGSNVLEFDIQNFGGPTAFDYKATIECINISDCDSRLAVTKALMCGGQIVFTTEGCGKPPQCPNPAPGD